MASDLPDGIARTGRPITNAALIMIVALVAFGVTGPIPPTEPGITLALAVLLDATVIWSSDFRTERDCRRAADKASCGRKDWTGPVRVSVPRWLRQAGCAEETFLEGPAVATPSPRRPTPFPSVTGGELSDDRCELVVAAFIDDHGVERVVGELTMARVTAGGAPRTHPDPVEPARDAHERSDDAEGSAIRPPAIALVAEFDPPMPVPVDPARVRPLDQDGSHGPACHYLPFIPL